MKVIHRTYNVNQAQIIVGYLQSNDIDACLLDAATSGALPGVGVRIAVPEDQESRAKWLLATVESSKGAADA